MSCRFAGIKAAGLGLSLACLSAGSGPAGALAAYPITMCPEPAVPPIIDGVLGEGEWDEGALLSPLLRVGDGGAPAEFTEVRVSHDAEALYVGVSLHDSQPEFIKADVVQDDGDVFRDDSVELFFITRLQRDEAGNRLPPFTYCHLAMNSRGVKLDDIDGDRTTDLVWDGQARVGPTGWTAEFRVDLTSGARPPLGWAWGVQVGRNLARLGEMSSWAGCRESFREPEQFGELRFGSNGLQFDLADVGQRRLGANEVTLLVRNRGAQKQDVKVNVRVMGRTRAGHAFTPTKVSVTPGQQQVVRAPYKVVEDGAGTILVSVTDTTGATVYRTAEYPFLNPSFTDALFGAEKLLADALIAWAQLPAGPAREAVRGEIDQLKARHHELTVRVGQREALPTLDQELLSRDLDALRADAEKLVQRLSAAATQGAATGFTVSAVSALEHVFADELVVLAAPSVSLDAARGESESFQVIVSPLDQAVEGVTLGVTDLQGPGGAAIPADAIRIRAVRGVPATSHLDRNEGPRQWPDALVDGPGTAAPVALEANRSATFWVTVAVPGNVPAGDYRGMVEVSDAEGARRAVEVAVTVYDVLLPAPTAMHFHLDVWQNPAAIAAYYRVPPWSEPHWQLLGLYVQDLARHGQKLITITRDMVEWRRDFAGTWSFDTIILDRYVDLCRQAGITGGLEFVPMFRLGGGNTISWVPDIGSTMLEEEAAPGDPLFQQAWTAFLRSLAAHLRQRGWMQNVFICPVAEPRDDAAQRQFLTAALLVKNADPAFRITTPLDSLDAARALEPHLDRTVLALREDVYDARFAEAERGLGKQVAWYLCRFPAQPNTFITSPAAEPRVLGWLSFREGMDGLLRGAYADWPTDPRGAPAGGGEAPAGDLFLVYPTPVGPAASARWERLYDGIEDFELLSMLKNAAALARAEGRVAQAQAAEKALEDLVGAVAGPVPSLTTCTTDPAVVAEAHQRLLQALAAAEAYRLQSPPTGEPAPTSGAAP